MSQRRSYKGKRVNGASNNTSLSTQLQSLSEMFPDWETEDLSTLLSEHKNDVEIVIDLIVNNKVAKWEPIKKEVKPRKKDDHHDHVPSANNPQHHEPISRPSKHQKEKPKTDKKREKKGAQLLKKETHLAQAAHTGTSNLGGQKTPVSKTESAKTDGRKGSSSWAAALGKDSRPKTKSGVTQLTKGPDEEKEEVATQDPVQEVARHSEEDDTNKQVSDQQTSWASAIKPKSKTPKVESTEPPLHDQVNDLPIEDNEANSQLVTNEVVEQGAPVTTYDSQATQISPSAVKESEVVLPQEVSNVGVSFGSLSLNENNTAIEEVERQRATKPPSSAPAISHQPTSEGTFQTSGGDIDKFNTSQTQEPQSAQQLQRSNDEQHNQQLQLKTAQPPQDGYLMRQEYHKGAPQVPEYYAQYQQIQQLFPQLAGAANLPGQFGYPGYDYTGAFGQAGLGSVSPAYYHNSIGNASQMKTGPHSGNANAEVSLSPLVPATNIAQQHLHSSQQTQQVPGSAPFGFPNYYYNYFNTPYYGNGAGISNAAGGFGMQQQVSDASSAGHHSSGAEGDAPQHQDAHAAQAANQNYGQYYGTPTQYGSRAGIPLYPSSQPFPQSVVQVGEGDQQHHPHAQQPQQQPQQQQQQQQQQSQTQHAQNRQQGSQSQGGPVPNAVPTFPQQMPQYANFQQYHQYGNFQDNNQYRGWY